LPDEIYEIIALAARYWFLFLMLLIAWRSYRWYVRDRKQYKKRLRLLPDAGYIGELVVMQGNEAIPKDTYFPVNREGVLGYLRSNDICVPIEGVANRHLWYSFDETDGLRVEPLRGRMIVADGNELIGKHQHAFLTHGSLLQVGQTKLRLRMFVGFEYAGEADALRKPMEESDSPEILDKLKDAPPDDRVRRMHEIAAWQAMQDDMETTGDGQSDGYHPETEESSADAIYPHDYSPVPDDWDHEEESYPQYYPPVMDDEDDMEDEDDFPHTEENRYGDSYEPHGDSPVFYPPVMEDEDDESLPLDANNNAPKSLYVGEDEAEQAKRVLWDKYLKGGDSR